jgi:hypothetical protein
MRDRLKGRQGVVLVITGVILGAVVAGPGASIAQKAMKNLTTTTADKRYVLRGETVAGGKTVEAKIDKFTTSTFSPIVTAKINAPSAGFLYVTGAVSAKDDSTTTSANHSKLQYRLSVGSTPLSNTPESFELFVSDVLPNVEGRENGAVTGVFKVARKGQLKVNLDAQQVVPDGAVTILGRSVSAVFVPKGKLPKTTKTGKTPPTGKTPVGP